MNNPEKNPHPTRGACQFRVARTSRIFEMMFSDYNCESNGDRYFRNSTVYIMYYMASIDWVGGVEAYRELSEDCEA